MSGFLAGLALCFAGMGTPNANGQCADWTLFQVGPFYVIDLGVEPGLFDASLVGVRYVSPKPE